MKKNATPELDAAWWRKNQPDGLACAKELERALDDYAKALHALQSKGDAASASDCGQALDGVETAASKAKAEAQKLAKNPPKHGKVDAEDLRFTADALERIDGVVREARSAAAKLVGQDDGDAVFAHDAYGAYIRSALGKLKDGPMAFAFGAGTKPDGHRLALKRNGSPESLATRLKATGLKKVIRGTARAAEQDAATIVLAIDGAAMSGLNAKYRLIRKHFGPLKYERVVAMVDGAVLADAADPEDPVEPDEADDAAAPAKAASTIRPDRSNRAPAASPVPDASALPNVVDAPPSAAPRAGERPAAATASVDVASALQGWARARDAAIGRLRQLGSAISASRDPDTREALVRLQAVTKNLTAQPDTPQRVDELERYLRTDDVFDDLASPNPFGLDLVVAPLLLDALMPLKRRFDASAAR